MAGTTRDLARAVFATLWLAAAAAPGWGQAATTVTAFERTIRVVGGSSQNVSTGRDEVRIVLDGTTILVRRNEIAVGGETVEIAGEGELSLRWQDGTLTVEIAGRRLARLRPDAGEDLAALRRRADAGDPEAQYALGLRYGTGDGVAHDNAAAARLFSAAAAQGFAPAQARYAVMLAHGYGVERDLSEAVLWYEEAAAQGETVAKGNLGFMLLHGQGVEPDPERGAALMREAARAGDHNAALNLYLLMGPEAVIPGDPRETLAFLRQAADHELPEALNRLGNVYRHGTLVPRDRARAAELFGAAFARGNLYAAFNHAQMTLLDGDPDGDVEEALGLLRAAADRGLDVAMNSLGAQYFEGLDVARDEAQGAAWFRRAAEAGDPMAIRNLGRAYETGRGIARDPDEARRLYERAVAAGDTRAAEDLQRLLEARTDFWFERDGRAEGPVPLERLQAMLSAGELAPATLVWISGMADWRPAADHPALVPE